VCADRATRPHKMLDALFPTLPSLPSAQTLPTVRMLVNVSRGCVSDGYEVSVGPSFRAPASCSRSVLSHTDASLVVRSPRGIGVNRAFVVSFIEGTNVITSNALVWNFDPPSIMITVPPVMLVANAEQTS
jgi:hypothetical protein